MRLQRLRWTGLVVALVLTATSAFGQEKKESVRVSISTSKGDIEVELDAVRAPGTVANFLRYVNARFYDGGQFHRTVTAANQPDSKVKIEVVQAGVRPDAAKFEFDPIKLERTRDTKLLHKNGTISMARGDPDTATGDFFICIGDQPDLDFGGKRNPDGQGFAAFGKVVSGMDVVKSIHAAPADEQKLKPAIRILAMTRQTPVKPSDVKPAEVKQPEAKKLETKQPEIKQPDTKKPEAKLPEAKRPDTKKSDAIQPATKVEPTNPKPDFLPKNEVPPPPITKSDAGRLTIDRIFASGEFVGEGTPKIAWQKKGGRYTTLEPATGGGRQLSAYDPATGTKEILVPEHWFTPPGDAKPLAVEDYAFSKDGSMLLIYTNSKRVWRHNTRGDYWVLDLSNRDLRKLGGSAAPSTLMFATFAPDGQSVAYVRENNLYVQNARDLRIAQLTKSGSPTIINGTFDWVYEEELDLRNGFRWSDDSQSIAYWQIDTEGVPEFFIVRNSDGPYSKVISIRYPKTGEKNPAAKIGVVGVAGGATRWLDIPGDPREHYLAKMEWIGGDLAVQQFNRLQNTNRVYLANPTYNVVHPIHTETDKAWVENDNDFHWLNDGANFVWLSERDGWRHAYSVSRDGDKVTPITKGNFDVIQIEANDEKSGWIYFAASPTNPTQKYLYRVSLKGGTPQRLTPSDQPGTHTYSISPDAQFAVHSYSTLNTPPVSNLISLPDHKVVKSLKDNAALAKKVGSLPKAELFRVNVGDGVELDGWCIKPPNFDETKKYPVLFYVYGEPAGQTVVDRWGGSNLLWHTMLAQQGYVVISVDNRGTPAPRGREWRKCIYRQVGVLSSADQANAVKELEKKWPWLDPQRVAIWGWSGGGSMTLNAIFRYPELYQTGMAVAAVPNQRHYDTIYQERYMGLPSDNADGYRKGSPIHFAHQLKGNLLLMHGTGDDNCHYLGTESLINELIAHNKHFSMMSYPDRAHGINEGRNTTRHVYETLTRYLTTNVDPRPLAK